MYSKMSCGDGLVEEITNLDLPGCSPKGFTLLDNFNGDTFLFRGGRSVRKRYRQRSRKIPKFTDRLYNVVLYLCSLP